MSTQKQRDANLRNAQLSTGPKTGEAKSHSARNALRHGFCAEDVTLHDDPETSQQVADRVTRYHDHYLPQSPLEEATVTEIAFCEIRLEHLVRAETGLLKLLPPTRLPAALLLRSRRQSLSQIRPREPPPRRRTSRSQHALGSRLARRRPGNRPHVPLRVAPSRPLRKSDQAPRHTDRQPPAGRRTGTAPAQASQPRKGAIAE